jgi:hypothetical protein
VTQVFISYARTDLDSVLEIESGLKAAGVLTWRDQEKLYGGQRWPKALGDAIAGQHGLLLFWSQAAAVSHFVEVEWCTAFAMRKPIIPCRLDDTAFPPALRAVQTVDCRQANEALPSLLRALDALSVEAIEPGRTEAVLARLSRISTTEPAKVVDEVRSAFVQKGWTVQGNVYQVAGDLHFGSAPQEPPKTQGSWLTTWQARVGFLVAVLTVFSLVLDLPTKVQQALRDVGRGPPTEATIEQTIAGEVWDEKGPLDGVQVSLLGLGLSTTTDQVGTFSFKVRGERDLELRLLAQKAGYQADPQYVTLGAKVHVRMWRVP